MPTTFEYTKKLSPFEVFLKYTNEKVITARFINNALKSIITRNKKLKLFDIGTGNAELISMALSEIHSNIEVFLLEPSADLSAEIGINLKKYCPNLKYKIINSDFEDYISTKKYEIVIASHLYHLKLEEVNEFLSKVMEMLAEDGVIIYIWRAKDDVSRFKELFKPRLNPRLYPKGWKAKTIDGFINQIDFNKLNIESKLFTKKNILKLSIGNSLEDVHSIIEFLLNTQWQDIKMVERSKILEYIIELKGKFIQEEGYLVLARKGNGLLDKIKI